MTSTLNKLVIFTAGAAAGSLVTWFLAKTKYERIADEEIASMKEYYEERESVMTKQIEEGDTVTPKRLPQDKPSLKEYAALVHAAGYSDEAFEEEEKKMNSVERPYVIPPEEFAELEDYNVVSLTYYADGVLADESDEIIEDVDDIVGLDSLSHFGEYEDYSVFVRNDERMSDYEILLDFRTYKEATNPEDPHLAEEE